MPRHRQAQPMLDLIASAGIPSFEERSPVEARTMLEAMRTPPGELPSLASVVEDEVAGAVRSALR